MTEKLAPFESSVSDQDLSSRPSRVVASWESSRIMQIAIIGSGYVGLDPQKAVHAGFAYAGTGRGAVEAQACGALVGDRS